VGASGLLPWYAVPGPEPVAEDDGRPTHPGDQGFLRTILRTQFVSLQRGMTAGGVEMPAAGLSDDGRDRGRNRGQTLSAASVGARADAGLPRWQVCSRWDFARSLRAASMARCTGSSGGVASVSPRSAPQSSPVVREGLSPADL
jgi:hypothetical protein